MGIENTNKDLMENLKGTIISFMETSSEKEYWDFKREWHKNNADLLKDIICMANNTTLEMHDAYLIIGIEEIGAKNHSYKITGVSQDSKRKNNADILDLLNSKKWSGEEIPSIELKTIEIDGKEIDVIVVHNRDKTPYYLIEDYSKTDIKGDKTIVRAGVIYSRVGDQNTSSSKCATKESVEFLWKKRFGLAGTDEFKIKKRLQDVNNWYCLDEPMTFYNSQYHDIEIRHNPECDVEFGMKEDDNANTATYVMDFPYLFASTINWNIGKNETIRRSKWDIYLDNRPVNISLFGVQATRQSYYHIEPNTYHFDNELRNAFDKEDIAHYHAYIRNGIELLAYKLLFSKQCYREDQRMMNKTFAVIPVFSDEQERINFMEHINKNRCEFVREVREMSIDEMFPLYSQTVNTTVIYKICKTMVRWLEKWRRSLIVK